MLLWKSILSDYMLSQDTLNGIWGLQKPLRDFFDREVYQGCTLGPNWGLSAGVPCAPAPKVR